MNNITKFKLTKESNEKVKENIIILDNDIKKFSLSKPNLRIYKSHANRNNSKNAIMTLLIINENYDEKNASLFEKLRHNFNKLVVIRKVKNLNPDRLEGIINQIELALSQKNYQEAMNKSLSLDKAYFPIVQKFLEELSIAIEIQNADKEIIKYLKSLT
jgi:hypothetical protein